MSKNRKISSNKAAPSTLVKSLATQAGVPQAAATSPTPAPSNVASPAQSTNEQAAKAGDLSFIYSRQFPSWLAENSVSLAFTTYHANRIFFIGLSPKGELSMSAQNFPRCMGLWASNDAQTLYMSHLFQILRFESMQDVNTAKKGIDRMYVPRHAFTTGDCDIHDVAANGKGLPVFVNTLYSCLATASQRYDDITL